MSHLWLSLAVAGGLGAVVRFLVDRSIARWDPGLGVPFATALINLSGSFLLGALTGWWAAQGGDPGLKLALGTGFLGGYTTFSTVCVESARLVRSGQGVAGLLHAFGTMLASVLLAALGIWFGQAV